MQYSINRLGIQIYCRSDDDQAAAIADAKVIMRGIGRSLRSFTITAQEEPFTIVELNTLIILTIGTQSWKEHWSHIADANLFSALSSLAPSPPTLCHLRVNDPFILNSIRELIQLPALAALESLEFVKALERVSVSGMLQSGLADEDDPEDLPDYEGWLDKLEGRGLRVKIAGQ
jgi:hypothetical protein